MLSIGAFTLNSLLRVMDGLNSHPSSWVKWRLVNDLARLAKEKNLNMILARPLSWYENQ